MSKNPFGPSMMLYKATKTVLVSRSTAIKIASAVVSGYWSEEDLVFQTPFDIRDDGEVWTIEGSGKLDPIAEQDARTRRGQLKMVISKYTGEILKLEH